MGDVSLLQKPAGLSRSKEGYLSEAFLTSQTINDRDKNDDDDCGVNDDGGKDLRDALLQIK